jgi:hypothetical protein
MARVSQNVLFDRRDHHPLRMTLAAHSGTLTAFGFG